MNEQTNPPASTGLPAAEVKCEELTPSPLVTEKVPQNDTSKPVVNESVPPPPVASQAAPADTVPPSPIVHFSPQEHRSALDVWSTRLAAWAQMVTVFVVIFGYFYTVRPVFQLQLLQEQTAQLQLENEIAKRRLAETIAAQASAQAKLAGLNAELASMAKSRDSLAAELTRESQKELQAMQKIASAQTQLSSQAGTLLITQRRLLYTRFSALFSWGFTFGLAPFLNPDDPEGKAFTKAQAEWPDLYGGLSRTLDKLEKNNETYREFPPELLFPLRRTLEEKKAELTCEPVNLDFLRQEYLKEMGAVESESRKDAVVELDKQRADALAKKQKLIVTDDDVQRFARSYRISRDYGITRKYNDQLQALWESCTKRARPVIELMSNKI